MKVKSSVIPCLSALREVFAPARMVCYTSALAVALFASYPSYAASPSTWNGGGADDNWTNALNWSSNVPVPSTTYDLIFAGTTRLTPNNDFAAASNFRNITFNAGAGAFVIGGNSITLNGGITNSSTNLQTINFDMVTTAVRTITTSTGGGDISLGGNISGTGGGITKTGTGTLTLNGAVSTTGATTVSGGTLTISSTGSLTNSAALLKAQSGASWNIDGTMTLSGSAGLWTEAGAVTTTINVGSSGTVNMGGTGVTSISQNTSGHTGILNVSGIFNQSAGQIYLGNAAGTGTLNVNNGGVMTFGTGMSASSTSGANNAVGVVLGRNGATGNINLNSGGVLEVGQNIIRGSGVGNFNFNGGTLKALANSTNTGLDVSTTTVNAGGAIIDTNNFNFTITDSMVAGTGTGGLSKLNTGTLTLAGNNAFSGNVSVSGGTLRGTVANAFGQASSTRTITVASGAILEFGGAGIYGGANSVAVPTIILNGGTLTNTSSNNPLNDLTLNGGTLTATASNGATWRSWNINGTITSTGNSAINSGTAPNPGILLSGPGTNTNIDVQNGVLTISTSVGNGRNASSPFAEHATSLTKQGIGTLEISGANTYTGLTTVSTGTLKIAKVAALYNSTTASWTSSNVRVASGATLAINVGGTGEFTTGDVTTLLTNLGGLGGAVAAGQGLGAGSTVAFDTTNASGGSFTVANNLANSTGAGGGSIGLNKIGVGTLVLSGNNSYTGNTTVNAGTLLVNGSTASGSAVTVNNTGTLGGTGTINGPVSLAGGATGTVLTSSGTLTIANTLSVLGLNNSVAAGVVSVSSGTTIGSGAALSVLGTLNGTVAVNAGTLSGSGTLNDAVTFTGGILAPGTSPGTLTINDALGLDSATVLNYDLLGTNLTVGGGINDLTTGITDLTLDGTLNVTETTAGSFLTAAVGDKWRLFNYSGTLTNSFLDLGAMPNLSSGLEFQIDTTTAGQVNLAVVAIPEPSTYAMLLCGGVMMWIVGRKRRS